jgi:hypothetical protein
MRFRNWCRAGMFVALAALWPLLTGCNHEPGDSCRAGAVFCIGKSRALECVQGKLADVACLGPAGCVEASHVCDRTRAAAGDACGGEWAACGADGKQFLECKLSKLTITNDCSGKRGCYARGKELHCDQSQANEGDRCTVARAACSLDGKAMLRCKDGKFAADLACRGPSGCKESENQVHCDQTLGIAGDACEGNGGACHVNGKELLECKAGKFEQVGFCRGADGCQLQGTQVKCDQSRGAIGDRCDTEGTVACALDGTRLLSCRQNELVPSKKCQCNVADASIACN